MKGNDDGYFFLDSVDEAKLQRHTLEHALRKLNQRVGKNAIRRARLLVVFAAPAEAAQGLADLSSSATSDFFKHVIRPSHIPFTIGMITGISHCR